MPMITLKLEKNFLREVDDTVKKNKYQSRTELIRELLREKVNESKLKQAIIELSQLRGASKRKTTQKEYEEAREKAFEMISKFK